MNKNSMRLNKFAEMENRRETKKFILKKPMEYIIHYASI